MKTKDHTSQVRDQVLEKFRAGLDIKQYSKFKIYTLSSGSSGVATTIQSTDEKTVDRATNCWQVATKKSDLHGGVMKEKPKVLLLKPATSHVGDTANMWKKVLSSDYAINLSEPACTILLVAEM